jgi:hypothetical protein
MHHRATPPKKVHFAFGSMHPTISGKAWLSPRLSAFWRDKGRGMLERFRKLSLGRKLVLILAVLAVPAMVLVQTDIVTGYMFEGGQKFGMVVTSWTVLALAVWLGWRAAK